MKTMILTDHLSFCDSNYSIFNKVNEIVKSSLEEVSIAPINISNKLMELDCAIMNMSEISSFYNGLLLATTIEQAYEIKSVKSNSQKCLYLWDLDWMYNTIEYEYIYNILSDKSLHIIVRSESHDKALQNLCDKYKCTDIMPTFDLENIWNLLKKTETL